MKRAFLVAMFAGGLCVAQTLAPVKVEGGLIQGTLDEGLTVYQGIPFAAPPVGELRWRAPQPAAKWDGVQTSGTSSDRDACRGWEPGGRQSGPATSEDCLYLNVWTPAKSAERTRARAGLDLRRRVHCGLHFRAQLQRRAAGPEGRGAGQHHLPRRAARFSGAPGIERRKHAPRFGQLRPAGHDRGPAVGAEEHRGIRRRSRAGSRSSANRPAASRSACCARRRWRRDCSTARSRRAAARSARRGPPRSPART